MLTLYLLIRLHENSVRYTSLLWLRISARKLFNRVPQEPLWLRSLCDSESAQVHISWYRYNIVTIIANLGSFLCLASRSPPKSEHLFFSSTFALQTWKLLWPRIPFDHEAWAVFWFRAIWGTPLRKLFCSRPRSWVPIPDRLANSCVCVCMYVMHVPMRTFVYMYIYIYIYIYMCVCVCVCVCKRILTCISICLCACECVCIYVPMYTYM
jgi:hypothetical protein